MSLVGDSMSHAVLPGAAVGFLVSGLSLPAMSVGGFVAGMTVALLAGLVTRHTGQREDASFAAFYLIALAAGVVLISARGSSVDLMHVLFGSVLAVDDAALVLVASITTLTLFALAVMYRPLVVESFDPGFLAAVGGRGGVWHLGFMMLVVLNLVAGFQALGTLMAVGLMMLPAAAARFWTREMGPMAAVAVAVAAGSGYAGLVISFHADVASGPAIVLVAGAVYVASLLFGTEGGLVVRRLRSRHLAA
jgi:zinc/manganese transport system permease protein